MKLNNGEEDRLSSLPEPILIHILSFLPPADAVSTMLVKKSFKTLWTQVSNLDFHNYIFVFQYSNIDNDEDQNDASRQIMWVWPSFIFVRNVLQRHQNPQIDVFRVRVVTIFCVDRDLQDFGHELDSWVNFALRKQVKILEFSATIDVVGIYHWPDGFFSDSLIELRLDSLSLNSLTRVRLSSLRVLKLVMVYVNDTVLGKIIRGCPVLKELKILHCRDVHMLSFDAPNVEKLTVINSRYCLEINCPNLKSLDFTGSVDSVNFIDLSSIVDVNVSFNITHQTLHVFKEFDKFVANLAKFASAARVELTHDTVTVLFYCMQKEAPQMTITWKFVKFSIWLNEKHIHGLNCMLRNLPQLEELVINITDRRLPRSLRAIEAKLDDDMSSQEEERWRFLKNVTINNIEKSSFAILVSLTELLLRKASVLNELVLRYSLSDTVCYFITEELSEFKQRRSTFPKASPHVRIRCIN